MRVLISEVTLMGGGKVCVAGWCDQLGRMVRPLLRYGGPHWPEALAHDQLIAPGNVLEFQPTNTAHNRPPPHSREDWVVAGNPTFVNTRTAAQTQGALGGSVSRSVRTLFNSLLRDQKYVEEGGGCPSLGAVEIEADEVNFYESFSKLRCWFSDNEGVQYDFPVTSKKLRGLYDCGGLGALEALKRPADIAHIRIGLANAWAGPNGDYAPRRCYAQANGIIFV